MKRVILLLLLVSVGLNIGLGLALKRQKDEIEAMPAWVHVARAPGDTARVGIRPGRERPHRGRMRDMRVRIEPQLAAQREAFDAARRALQAAMSHEEADEAEIMALVGDMIAAQGGIDSLVVSNLVKEMRLMSPAERQEVLHMLDRFGGGFRGRGKGRPPVSP
jgi:hypothetical protein